MNESPIPGHEPYSSSVFKDYWERGGTRFSKRAKGCECAFCRGIYKSEGEIADRLKAIAKPTGRKGSCANG